MKAVVYDSCESRAGGHARASRANGKARWFVMISRATRRHLRWARPLADAFNQWMVLQRQKIPESFATARALDYSLKRRVALTRFVDDGQLPIDNNGAENPIRPIEIGQKKSGYLQDHCAPVIAPLRS